LWILFLHSWFCDNCVILLLHSWFCHNCWILLSAFLGLQQLCDTFLQFLVFLQTGLRRILKHPHMTLLLALQGWR
jgi:hypothetical protein